jgi:metal-responsive CopG/Arc/MetJ family transcriptional regulator
MTEKSETIRDWVRAYLLDEEVPSKIHAMIEEELMRKAIREELDRKENKNKWKMRMSQVLQSGCMINYNSSGF